MIDRSKWAAERFSKMSPDVQQFVRALRPSWLAKDSIAFAHVFDNKRPANSKFVLWEVHAIVDVVKYLPADWQG